MPDIDKNPTMCSRYERMRSILEGHPRFAPLVFAAPKQTLRDSAGQRRTYAEPVIAATKIVHDRGGDVCLCKREVALAAAAEVLDIPVAEVVKTPVRSEKKLRIPPDSHIKRVGTVLSAWPSYSQLSVSQITVSTGAGTLDVSEDCYGIAAILCNRFQGALSARRERVFEVAQAYLEGDRIEGLPSFQDRQKSQEIESPVEALTRQLQAVQSQLAEEKERNRQLATVRKTTAKNGMFDVPVEISIYTLLVSAIQLSQLDTTKGAQDRRQRMEGIAEEYLDTKSATSKGAEKASADLA